MLLLRMSSQGFSLNDARVATAASLYQDSSANVTGGAFRGARGYVPGPLLSNIWSRQTTRMYSEFESFFRRY